LLLHTLAVTTVGDKIVNTTSLKIFKLFHFANFSLKHRRRLTVPERLFWRRWDLLVAIPFSADQLSPGPFHSARRTTPKYDEMLRRSV